jgi:NitT/TauT family transport system substrate-binding protein
MKNLLRLEALALLAVAIFAAAAAQAANEPMTLRLAQSTPMLWPQTRIADGAGLWAKQGLTVKSTLFATGREAMQALLGGQADVAEVAPTPLVLAAFADQPVRAFAVVARWSPWRVLVRTDRGIAQPSQLKGKKIGIAVGTSSDLAFSYFLESNGMSKSDVEIVNVSPPDMIPALDSGSVDAINIWQPYTYEAETRLGAKVKGMPYTFTNNYLLLTTTEIAAKNPELLKRTLAVLREADASLGANKDKAVEWTAKAAGMKPDTLKAVWSEMEFGTKPPDARVLEEMQAFANFAVKNKMVKEGTKMPDLKGLILVVP